MSEPTDTPRCTARSSQSGDRCRNRPMKGSTVCSTHGGLAPQVRAAAERRQVEAEARQVVSRLLADPGAEPVDNPVLELQRVVGRIGHAVDVLGARVNELDGAGSLEYEDRAGVRRAAVLAEMWERLSVEYRRALNDMVRLGIDAQESRRVWEARGERVKAALGRVFVRLGLDVSDEVVARVVREELLAEAGEGSV